MASNRLHRHRSALFGAVWAAIWIAAALSGCFRATPTPEPVTISFACPRSDVDLYQAWVEQFNAKYPYITVTLEPKSWDALGGLDAGNADTFITSQFALNWLQDDVLNLSPLIDQDPSSNTADFYQGTLQLYTREGKIWAIPAGVDLMVMYYNQDLFDAAGMSYPKIGWTWDDFMSTASTLRDPETDVFGYASTLEVFDALTFIYQHNGRIFDDLENPTETTFDDPNNIEAMNWFVKLMFDYNVMPTPEQAQMSFGRGDVRNGVYENQVAMWSGMLSERGGKLWRTEWPMRWGVAPLPRDVRAVTMTLVEGYFISAGTQYPDACWKWISFLSQQLPARAAPVRRSLVKSAQYEREVGSETVAVVEASMQDALLLSPRLADYEDALGVFMEAYAAIVSGQATPKEALTLAQQRSR